MPDLPKPAVSSFSHSIPQRAEEAKADPSSRRKSWIPSFLRHTRLDDDVCNQDYPGNGTADDPYVIDFLQNDGEDALNFSKTRKWAIVITQALSIFTVTFASSAYSPTIESLIRRFDVSTEVATLGLSLFVWGFAMGPLFWAPLSEVYGRSLTFVISSTMYTLLNVGVTLAPNITGLLLLRFFASAFGSAAMTNSGGTISDMFNQVERGVAMGLFAAAPFLGPAVGPIAGGFLNETKGWRWVLGLITIVSGVVCIAGISVTRETYAPFIMRRRAKALSRMTGRVYASRLDAGKPPKRLSQEVKGALTRPWILLFSEPIIMLATVYISIIYGTLYMFFAGFPIVFQVGRGWSQGIGGLPFAGVAVGVIIATTTSGFDNKRYARLSAAATAEGRLVPPEARLPRAMVGALILPIGLFMFAWTTYPSIPWIVPIIGAVIFSAGLVLVFTGLIGYLIDAYVIYAASVMASSSVVRYSFGAAFPLFTTRMYESLGNQWASSIPAFLLLGCLPFPFLFYKYGAYIRSKCKHASEAAKMLEMMRRRRAAAAAATGGEQKQPEKEVV
ncbi:MFS general substrate transporter [Trichoderma sp. SZMC 28014]